MIRRKAGQRTEGPRSYRFTNNRLPSFFGWSPVPGLHLKNRDRRQHDFFKKETSDFIRKSEAGDRNVSTELLEFLTTWLVGHIVGSDAKYAPYLNG